MYGTYLRLDITVHDSWRTVVRAASRKLTRRTPGIRSAGPLVTDSTVRCSTITARNRSSCGPGSSEAPCIGRSLSLSLSLIHLIPA